MDKKTKSRKEAKTAVVPEISTDMVKDVVIDIVDLGPPDNEMTSLYRMVKRRLSDFSIGQKVPLPRVVFTRFVDDCTASLAHKQRFAVYLWCCVDKGAMSMNRLISFTIDIMQALDAPYKVGEFTLSPVRINYENHSGAGMRYSRVMMTLEPKLSEPELKKLEERQQEAEEKARLLRVESQRKAEEDTKKLQEEETARIAQ